VGGEEPDPCRRPRQGQVQGSLGRRQGRRLAKSVDEVKEFVTQMLGATLVTEQTGPAGKQVNRLYIEDGSDIEKEFYLSLLVDRETSASPSSSRPKAAWTSRRSRMTRRRRS
jgi:hypothetical protein